MADQESDFFPEFGPLADALAPTDGPERRTTYASDHRVGPRLPHGSTVGERPNIHRSRYGVDPNVDAEADLEAEFSTAPGDVVVRPSSSSEALGWREKVGFVELASATPDGLTAFEVARADVPEWATNVVERLATYLRATPLDAEGSPVGPTYATGCCVDPFGPPVHPTSGLPLRVRWSLLGANIGDPSFSGPEHAVLGRDVQIDQHWNDQRFAWGSRYTVGLQLVVATGITSVRLVATPDTSGSPWSLAVGGRLGVYSVGGGPREQALAAATTRR